MIHTWIKSRITTISAVAALHICQIAAIDYIVAPLVCIVLIPYRITGHKCYRIQRITRANLERTCSEVLQVKRQITIALKLHMMHAGASYSCSVFFAFGNLPAFNFIPISVKNTHINRCIVGSSMTVYCTFLYFTGNS